MVALARQRLLWGKKVAKQTWVDSVAGSVVVNLANTGTISQSPHIIFLKRPPQDGALVTVVLGGFLGFDGQISWGDTWGVPGQ